MLNKRKKKIFLSVGSFFLWKMFEKDKRNSYICVQKVDEATGLLMEEQLTLEELLEEFKRINNNLKIERSCH